MSDTYTRLLKPCPFCGGEAKELASWSADRNYVLEEAAKAAETAQISGSLMRPGIAKVIRALKAREDTDLEAR